VSSIAEVLAGWIPEPEEVRVCSLCGCTDLDACQDPDTGLPCSWVNGLGDEDVCTVCAKTAAAVENSTRVEIYSPHEAQQFIESTRAAREAIAL
jgi:hypothetical protein